jgi:hypothetical protein
LRNAPRFFGPFTLHAVGRRGPRQWPRCSSAPPSPLRTSRCPSGSALPSRCRSAQPPSATQPWQLASGDDLGWSMRHNGLAQWLTQALLVCNCVAAISRRLWHRTSWPATHRALGLHVGTIFERRIVAHGKVATWPRRLCAKASVWLARTRRCGRRAAPSMPARHADAADANRIMRCVHAALQPPCRRPSRVIVRTSWVARARASFQVGSKRGVAAVARLPRCRLATPTPPMQAGSCDAAMLARRRCVRALGARNESMGELGELGELASFSRRRKAAPMLPVAEM